MLPERKKGGSMKRFLFGGVFVGGIFVFFLSPLFAAFTSQGVSTITATAELTGSGIVQMGVELDNLSDNNTTTWIYWSGVTLPAGWEVASAYILLRSTITSASGGIRIYTDNKATDADPKYTGTADGGGLVDVSSTTKKLPIGWTIRESTTSVSGADPNDDYSWFYFKDASDSDFWSTADTIDYSRIKTADGIHYAQGSGNYGGGTSPDVVYIEADFTNAVTPRTYKTSTIRVEAYTE